MRRASLAVFAAAHLIACGGSDGGSNTPDRESACKSNVSTYCNKLFQCDPTGVGAFGQFASATDCISNLSTPCTTANNYGCPGGTSFNVSNAGTRNTDVNNQSCTDVNAAKRPPSCKAFVICQ